MILRDWLINRGLDIHYYGQMYFTYPAGKAIPWGNEPMDFSMRPVGELFLEVNPGMKVEK